MNKLLGINLSILYFFQVAVVILLSVGLFPLYYSWVIVAVAVYLFYKESFEKCFYYFICSLPFFVATPFFSFESLSLWRPLSIFLILKYFFEERKKIISNLKFRISHLGKTIFTIKNFILNPQSIKSNAELLAVAAFFSVCFFGLLIAQDKIAAIKTILYYFNIAIIGFFAWHIIKSKTIFNNTVKSVFISGIIILFVAVIQEISVFIVTLNQFWSFWAQGPSLAYYGQTISDLLLASNTWFSYWPGDFATLRAFSIFQDSHSFGLMMVFMLIPAVYFYFIIKKSTLFRVPLFQWLIAILLLFVIFSGTRGLWVSFYAILIPVIIISIYYFKNNFLIIIKKDIFKLIATFIICFFVASGFWFAQIYVQNTSKSPDDILLAFKRIKSSFDLSEISNKGRIEIWKRSLETAVKNPIIGVGAGNFPVALNEKISNVKKGASAHNLYLQFLVENGLLGLLAVVIIFYKILQKSYLALKQKKVFAIGFFIAFIWLLGYNLFDVAFLNDKVFIVFTVLTILLYKSENFSINFNPPPKYS